MRRFHYGLLLAAIVLSVSARVAAQEPAPTTIPEMWNTWCARCHGLDGKGKVAEPTVTVQPRDFTECKTATGEADPDWSIAITKGGPAVGLSPQMPGFGDTLKPEQIQGFVDHLRTFCVEPGWPDGNMNLPRPLFTEKAFPEDELVLTPVASHVKGQRTEWRMETTLEKRIGKRWQLELLLPFSTAAIDNNRYTGFGDFEIGMKYVVNPKVHNHLVTVAIDVTTPTGSQSKGLGTGEMGFEPYVATASAWGYTYFQTQLKIEMPKTGPWENKVVVYRMAFSHDVKPSPSGWNLGIELTGENKDVAITPQVRKGLSPSGAIAGAVGVSLPVNNTDEQGAKFVGYILWEFLERVYWRRP